MIEKGKTKNHEIQSCFEMDEPFRLLKLVSPFVLSKIWPDFLVLAVF